MILLASNRFDYIFIGKIDQAGLLFADRIKIIQDLNDACVRTFFVLQITSRIGNF